MKVVAIVQARMGSTRLPGKVMKPLLGEPMLAVLLKRILLTPGVDETVVATSRGAADDHIAGLVGQLTGVRCYRGPEDDVLTRFYEAACATRAEVVLRVTADNPLFDAPTAHELISRVRDEGYDYASNSLVRTFPYGLDLEAFTFQALEAAYREAGTAERREHVTPFVREHPERFRFYSLTRSPDVSHVRVTVDTEDDYTYVRSAFEAFGFAVTYHDLLGSFEDERAPR